MKSVFIHTFGCKVNQYDSQLLRDTLKNNGYTITQNSSDAELIVINTCTVTKEADRQAKSLSRSIAEKNPDAKIILTGCLPKTLVEEQSESDGITYVKDINKYLKLNTQYNHGIANFDGHSRAFIKIQDGCDAFCSYCIVPYARNIISSREESDVIREVERLVDSGYAEVVLSGIRLGKYSHGLNNLLKKLLDIKKDFRIRLSSLEVKEVDGELLSLIKENEKLCPHLHIPLQSGSDRILGLMNRPYTVKEYQIMAANIKAKIDDIALTTDIMTGFPDESDQDFDSSYNVVKELSFSRLHVFRYSLRPGTKAAGFNNHISEMIKKARSRKLLELGKTMEQSFLHQNKDKIRLGIRENNNTILTDNYIHLPLTHDPLQKKPIIKIKVKIKNNTYYADPQ